VYRKLGGEARGVLTMDITRTIPAEEDSAHVESSFDGSWTEAYWPFPFEPRNVTMGDWFYITYRGEVRGRCQVLEVELADPPGTPSVVGTRPQPIGTRSWVHVRCPGERAPRRIVRKGHQGIRYDQVPEWSARGKR
jgi:hypothetical protein